MSEIEGSSSNPLSHSEQVQYQEKYQEALSCFKESFSDYTAKKGNSDELQQVMEDSLDLLNQTAKAGLSKQKQEANQKLHSDYESYMNHPSKEKASDIKQDIDALS